MKKNHSPDIGDDTKSIIDYIVKEKRGTIIRNCYKSRNDDKWKITIKCKEGHIWDPYIDNLMYSDAWCQKCYHTVYSIHDLHKHAESMGGKCLSSKYTNIKSKYKWKCGQCDHEWDAIWNSVCNMHSWCPNCRNSSREVVVKLACEEYTGYKFNKSRTILGKGIEVDLYCEELDLCIEVDGIQHHEYTPYYHSNIEAFNAQQERDKNKDRLAEEKGIILDRIPDKTEVPLIKLREYIHNYLQETCFIDPPDNLKSDQEFYSKVAKTRTSKSDKYMTNVKKIVNEKFGKLIGDQKCISNRQKLHIECCDGHKFNISYEHLIRGIWCGKCSITAPIHVSDVQQKVESRGYKFISCENKKKGTDSKSRKYVTIKCPIPDHPEFEIRWSNFTANGSGCTHCGKIKSVSSRRLKNNDVSIRLDKCGLKLIEPYKNLTSNTNFECTEGHKFTLSIKTVENLKNNYGCNNCPVCIMNNYEDIKLLSNYDINSSVKETLLKFQCLKCNKLFEAKFVGMQQRKYKCGKHCH
jgi:very-short-patch-repair endonuclease